MTTNPNNEKTEAPLRLVEKHLRKIRTLEFTHEGKKFQVTVTVSETLSSTNRLHLTIFIKSAKKSRGYIINHPLGDISGKFCISKNNTREFFTDRSSNHSVTDRHQVITKNEDHVPHLIQETIAQLVDHEIIQVWHSSASLSEGGKRMYEALLTDTRLQGKKSISGEVVT